MNLSVDWVAQRSGPDRERNGANEKKASNHGYRTRILQPGALELRNVFAAMFTAAMLPAAWFPAAMFPAAMFPAAMSSAEDVFR
jgi:hypothetical protein